MKQSDFPAGFNAPFAWNAGGGFIAAIPDTTGTPGRAALDTGFPPINFDPVASGGIPPFGKDFNGVLNQATAWAQVLAAGGTVQYGAGYSTAIGGYPKGAVLSSNPFGSLWQSTADDNTTDPDASGAGWVNLLTPLAPLASPALTGAPTAPTQSPGNNTTRLATTAFIQAALTALFAGSAITSPGYLKVAGLVIQWGTTASFTVGSPVTETFPITFPTALFGIVVTGLLVSGSGSIFGSIASQSTSGFTANSSGTASGSQTMFWIALGR